MTITLVPFALIQQNNRTVRQMTHQGDLPPTYCAAVSGKREICLLSNNGGPLRTTSINDVLDSARVNNLPEG
jgi:hypothetical protein